MNLSWDPQGSEDYWYWQQTDKKILKKINELIRDTMRQPFEGLGKPEGLKANLAGCWSRRIDQEHRVVYRVNNNNIHILMCRYHY
ncbi:Txe/YoeB family addiction module toxin [Chitinophaga sp. 22620]|uniref:Txe/YoeB family addiction module toxin n=1 Tax=Chitinophaga sp. 22620 TaxID=3453952 RepID=UPI003F85A564